ncbi:hypothetical protein HF319_02455 [Xanthomonas sp. Kuri4-1]
MTIGSKAFLLLSASLLVSSGIPGSASGASSLKKLAIPPVDGRLRVVDKQGDPIPGALVRITQRVEVGTRRLCVQVSTFGAMGGGGKDCGKYRLTHLFKGEIGGNGEQDFTVAHAETLIIELVGRCDGKAQFPSRKYATRFVPWKEFLANPVLQVRGVDDGDHWGEVGCMDGRQPFEKWEGYY